MASHEAMTAELHELASQLEVTAFGVADTGKLHQEAPGLFDRLPRASPRAAVIGVRLQDAVLDAIADQPTPLYFHMYRQANYALDRAAFQIANRLQKAGYDALAVPASQIVQREPMQGHISHKLLGWAAGIGWIGRQTLLVHPQYGSRMRYVSILTDAPLAAGEPMDRDCGACRRCIGVCPAGAIRERREDFDLDACYRKLTEFSKLPRVGQHICGVCVKACGGAGWTGGSDQ